MPISNSKTIPTLEDLRPLTVSEVANLIRKSHRDVERKIADGVFPTLEPPARGRTPLIPAEAVRAYLMGGAR